MLAISPLDGRYYNRIQVLSQYFSEFALVKTRLDIEVRYLCYLFSNSLSNKCDENFEKLKVFLLQTIEDFNETEFLKIKEIEKTTNHDVKAIEYYLRDKISVFSSNNENDNVYINFIHFGLTSHDVNSPAMILGWKRALSDVFIPQMEKMIQILSEKKNEWWDTYMLARTHGQSATPTSLGKEVGVYINRLGEQYEQLKRYKWRAKMGGANGNLNAHYIAYPNKNWHNFFDNFLFSNYKLIRQQKTTQVGCFDDYSELFHIFTRINSILIDFNRDLWLYISYGYFKIQTDESEIGSSTMPHKINPIQFENSEGNLMLANCLLQFLAIQLPLSKMQRDLVNSTLHRNFGVVAGHTLLGWKNFINGFSKLSVNKQTLDNDLNKDWAILAEPVQIILKREGVLNSYEIVKKYFRSGENMSSTDYKTFIENLERYISDVNIDLELVKNYLIHLTPSDYAKVPFLVHEELPS